MKIGTITFHSSYNHGSCLQAYALQSFVENQIVEGCRYEIINLRTPIQKAMYESVFVKKGIKNIAKRIVFCRYRKRFNSRAERYEAFISNRLHCTKEYKSLEELKGASLDYDCYISGSDQLWNLAAKDFDWSNYLEFTDSKRKISYAASFGPLAQKWSETDKERIREDLKQYSAISVREEGSAKNVELLLGKRPVINVDPTLLLDSDEWGKIVDKKPVVEGSYIFLYDVKCKKDAYEIAKRASKKLDLPVVIVTSNAKFHVLYNGFIKKYEAGPEEFLNLVKNAKLVISSSFHGTVFSIIFRKPFFSVNGSRDFRISNLLKRLGLMDRCVAMNNIDDKIAQAFDINYANTQSELDKEVARAKAYLEKNLKK